MSQSVLVCPVCREPVPPRQSRPIGRVPRYTCAACGEVTLHSELLHERRLSINGGGAASLLLASLDAVGLPEVIFPGTPGIAVLTFLWYDIPDLTVSASRIDRVVITVGILDSPGTPSNALPTVVTKWRQGVGGPSSGASVGAVVEHNIPVELSTQNLTVCPAGTAWTRAIFNTLQVTVEVTTNDNGSGIGTAVDLSSINVRVWGTP